MVSEPLKNPKPKPKTLTKKNIVAKNPPEIHHMLLFLLLPLFSPTPNPNPSFPAPPSLHLPPDLVILLKAERGLVFTFRRRPNIANASTSQIGNRNRLLNLRSATAATSRILMYHRHRPYLKLVLSTSPTTIQTYPSSSLFVAAYSSPPRLHHQR